jgi:hypothetical protein
MKSTTKSTALVLSIAAVLMVGAAGCSQKYGAERDAKKAGQAVCDISDADSADKAQAAVDDAQSQLDDLGSKYALYTAEDRQDIQNNLADLAEHAIQGNDLLVQQDVAVLRRSVENVRNDTSEVSRAAWDGFLEGLSDCSE